MFRYVNTNLVIESLSHKKTNQTTQVLIMKRGDSPWQWHTGLCNAPHSCCYFFSSAKLQELIIKLSVIHSELQQSFLWNFLFYFFFKSASCLLLLLPSVCWQPLFSEDIGGPFTVLHSVSHVQNGVHTMEVLLLHIKEDLEETKGSGYVQVLEWITVSSTAGQGGWCRQLMHWTWLEFISSMKSFFLKTLFFN